MIPLSVGRIADLVGGRLLSAQSRDVRVDGSVEFDSRRCGPGSLFVALPGEHVDGHDYLDAAARAGAAAAIVTRRHASRAPDPPRAPDPSRASDSSTAADAFDAPDQLALIQVRDAQEALGALAAAVLRELPARTVGVTGSSGKTSTKDLMAALLEPLGPTIAPPGSFNNELGLPHTVLRADERTRFLVLEYSARGIGHIAYLTGIARPTIAAVLNVGSAHLGEFGSREAIARAKGELVEALPSATEGGVAVLNLDDPMVAAMAGRTSARVIGYSVGADGAGRDAPANGDAQLRAVDVALDDAGRARFRLVCDQGEAPVRLSLVGAHHVGNALAAAAAALECGATLEDVVRGLGAASPRSPGRMERHDRADGVTVIDDAYNANPESMRAAVDALVRIGAARAPRGGRSWAVLGPMAELGPDAARQHAALGRYAAQAGVDRLLAVGEDAAPIARAAAAASDWAGEAIEAADIDAALSCLEPRLRPGDVVLVKASHSHGLERLARALVRAPQAPQAPQPAQPAEPAQPAPLRGESCAPATDDSAQKPGEPGQPREPGPAGRAQSEGRGGR